ncbi:MAG TPA: CDP-archaeol synthase [Gammaproteobacteria bacterium]
MVLTETFIHCLFLIVLANGAPVLSQKFLGGRFNQPVDFGFIFVDGKRLLGDSKTWRGLLASLAITAPAAWLLGYEWQTGLLLALYSMLGDLLSSFIKRRMAMASSSMAPLIDQIPESLLPAWLLHEQFALDVESIVILVGLFIVLELVLSRILYIWGIRRRPY